MEKLQGTSMDIVQDNIEKLKQIFPEIFTEGKIDFQVLKQLLGEHIENDKERYSFTWKGKTQARQIAQDMSTGTLCPDRDNSKDWENTENLYIEGDNLEVLKLLQKSYHRKIKMIYIDPPYNTGKDFVYKDNFRDNIDNYLTITGQKSENSTGGGYKLTTNSETNGRYHSDWLNMMYPRLKLARNLLTDDGVIFISIDDNEVTNLKKICDEIFGEDNFISQVIIKNNPGGRDYGSFALTHEYLIVYSKKVNTELNMVEKKDQVFPFYDEKGGFSLMELRNRNIKFNNMNRPNLYYPFYINLNKIDKNNLFEISLIKQEGWIELYPQESQGVKTVWRWGKEKSQENLNIEIKAKKKLDGGFQIVQKNRTTLKRERTIWDETDLRNEAGSLLLKKVFDESKPFDYPKSLELIKRSLKLGTNEMEDDIILDFFSGSATTAHAVMQLNAEDGGNRKYIMVQLPEVCDEKSEAYKAGYKNICEIGKERIRRAGEKVKSDETLPAENREKLDIGFKVFKLDSSNIKEWDSETEDLRQSLFDSIDNIKSDRTSLDILYEILLKYGLDLNVPIVENKHFYSIGGGTLLINLDKEIDMEVIDSICEEYKTLLEIDEDFKTTVVLRDSSFANDVDKTNAMKKLEQVGINEVRSI